MQEDIQHAQKEDWEQNQGCSRKNGKLNTVDFPDGFKTELWIRRHLIYGLLSNYVLSGGKSEKETNRMLYLYYTVLSWSMKRDFLWTNIPLEVRFYKLFIIYAFEYNS